ncbi:hypothetical protein, partial [Nocardia cyriacigeorgica]|uniref:hypothetical protein n=1 Tax=Nocardia cyriacigeorgica TaxID=135487 RepID=UPI0024574E55
MAAVATVVASERVYELPGGGVGAVDLTPIGVSASSNRASSSSSRAVYGLSRSLRCSADNHLTTSTTTTIT